MFTFKIFEIPEGKSTKEINLVSEDLDLGDIAFNSGTIHVEFDRSNQFIRTVMSIHAVIELICDRSLDKFEFNVHQNYEILFKFEIIEEAADENGAIRNIDHSSKQINIEQDVSDTILVNLPTKKLHPRFLDQDGNPLEFQEQSFGVPEDKDEEVIDPRWAALKELKK